MGTDGEIKWSRWKPTKRQKEILEELFRKGHCNPSRSHIDEITIQLKEHGNVQAKNVFYWFHNTHERYKRKQKMETRQMQQSPGESTVPQRQNTQNETTHQMQQSPTESTVPQRQNTQNEKDIIVKSLDSQTYSCPAKGKL